MMSRHSVAMAQTADEGQDMILSFVGTFLHLIRSAFHVRPPSMFLNVFAITANYLPTIYFILVLSTRLS